MMDRLKFRAFYKDFPLRDDEKGEYTKSFMIYNVVVYGDHDVGTYVEDFEAQLTEQGFTEDEIKQLRDYITYSEYDRWVNCWANDVEQCTGVKDQNGKLIYEGDIVKSGNNGQFMYKIGFNKRVASFVLLRKEDAFNHYFGEAVEAEDVEIIGNIHENGELLK